MFWQLVALDAVVFVFVIVVVDGGVDGDDGGSFKATKPRAM